MLHAIRLLWQHDIGRPVKENGKAFHADFFVRFRHVRFNFRERQVNFALAERYLELRADML